jgi:eukaryotic-like serine/threonine-protein kinase
MGGACFEAGRVGDGVVAFELVYGHYLAKNGPDARDTLAVGRNFGSTLWHTGQFDRAVTLFEDLAARYRRVFGENDPETWFTLGNLAVNLRDSGRVQEALALFADVRRRAQAAAAPDAAFLDFLATEELGALAKAGRREEVIAAAKARVEAIRRRHPPSSPPLAAELNGVALTLLEAGAFADAEPILREVIAVRSQQLAGTWQESNSRALLGEVLAGLGRFAEAEPLVTGGGEGVLAHGAKVPRVPRDWPALAPERVRRFYTAWAAAAPGQGQEAKLAAWLAMVGVPAGDAGK